MDTPAVADGPIAFLTDDGQQVLIPLSAISFDANGVKSTFNYDGLQAWLNYLVTQGRITPGPAPAAAEAMVFEAAVAGIEGNDILVEVEAVSTTTVRITVTETHVAEGLNFKVGDDNFVGKVLASGLVHVKTGFAGTATDDPDKTTMITTSDKTWDIKKGANVLMTLEAHSGGAGIEKGTMTISIDQVDTTAHTFRLGATWKSTPITVVAPGDLDTTKSPLTDLGFAVKVKKPASAPLALPAPGAVMLRGGAEIVPQVDAQPATATLLANT
jgi:hypothetical protein